MDASISKKPLALIVEDDPKLRTIFEKVLETAEFDTRKAHDGEHASEQLKNFVPHLILLDIHLPYLSGADLFERIKADSRFANSKIIIVTADLYKAKTLEGRADHILVKPVGFYRLYDLIMSMRPTFVE